MRDKDRFRGCLIGGAAGDALGYAVEFMRERDIFRRYGEQGITRYDLCRGSALISDDTQMTLFTAAGLLRGDAIGIGREEYARCVNEQYLDWLRTQGRRRPEGGEKNHSWLMNVRDLFSPRAPGNTCLAALQAGGGGTPESPINNSKGCGGVMRVAPIGLYFGDRGFSVAEICRLGAQAAALTHGHALGWMPGGALAQIVHEVSQDGAEIAEDALHALSVIRELWPDRGEAESFDRLIRKALDLAAGDKDDLSAIHELGEGWVGDEALAIALYCAVRHSGDIDGALIASVNHRGDSDSTGAIAGNIVGAQVGLSGIPEKYTDHLELRDVIIEIADDLCSGRPEDGSADEAVWKQKYVDMTYEM